MVRRLFCGVGLCDYGISYQLQDQDIQVAKDQFASSADGGMLQCTVCLVTYFILTKNIAVQKNAKWS
jgi:hypothetical protein